MRKQFFLSGLLLFSALTPMIAQSSGQKQVRIYIDEDGRKMDTTIVWTPMDQAQVEKMISRFMQDSLGSMDFHDADIFDNTLPPPHAFFFSEDHFPGRNRMIWTRPFGNDSVAFSYFFNDSAGFHSFDKNLFFDWKGDSVNDSLFAENFPFGSNKLEIEKFLQENGNGKRVKVIVESPDVDKSSTMPGKDGSYFGWHTRTGKENRTAVELHDVTSKNELSLSNIQVSGMTEDGKLTLRFSTGISGNLKLRVTDEKKNEVFSQELKFFDGDFKQEIQLNPTVKGTYLLTIQQGKKKAIKELVVR